VSSSLPLKQAAISYLPQSNNWLNEPIQSIQLFNGKDCVDVDVPNGKDDYKSFMVHLSSVLEEIAADGLIGWNLKDLLCRLRVQLDTKANNKDWPLLKLSLYDIRLLYQLKYGKEPPNPQFLKPKEQKTSEFYYNAFKVFSSDIPTIYNVLTQNAIREYSQLDVSGINTVSGLAFTNSQVDGTITGRLTNESGKGYITPLVCPKGAPRGQVKASTEHDMIIFDYGSMEMRVLAALTNCPKLSEILAAPGDFYTNLGKILSRKESVPQDVRKLMKGLCFLCVFGGSEYGISKEFGVSIERAGIYLYNFFELFPEIETWILQTHIDTIESAGITNPFGRFRSFKSIRSLNQVQQAPLLRSAQNFKVQSTAADINTLVFLNLCFLFREQFGAHVMFHIHDGYVVSCPKEHSESLMRAANNIFNNPPVQLLCDNFSVDLKVSFEKTNCWK